MSSHSLWERLRTLSNLQMSVLTALVLALIFTSNAFHFSQYRINKVFDQTSEGLVVGRMARAAAEGIGSKAASLGANYNVNDPPEKAGQYSDQIKYFENPELIRTENPEWASYQSQLGLQGIVYSLIDKVDPLPRRYRIGFYHFLSALLCAAAFMWIACMVRNRFGFAASIGFVLPVGFEPMFTALAPNLYWAVGLWFVPMAIAMLLAEADSRRRKLWLIVWVGAAVFAKSLCGYEFITTVIAAAMVGCLLNTREDYLRTNIVDMMWVGLAGLAGFSFAMLVHASRFGFAIILSRAIDRTTADGSSLEMNLILGAFAPISSVLRTYFTANDYTQIRNFGLVFGLIGAVGVVAFFDEQFSWFLGGDRKKIRVLAFAYLTSFAAPLSWFIIAKGHAVDHIAIDFILWYVPTMPIGGALVGLAVSELFANRWTWSVSGFRSFLTLAIPSVVLLTVLLVLALDWRIDQRGTWVLEAHAHGTRVFADPDMGVDLRMNDRWFTVEYNCERSFPDDTFVIHAYNGETLTNYDFRMTERVVSTTTKGKCYYAQQKEPDPITRLEIGLKSFGRRIAWHRELDLADHK